MRSDLKKSEQENLTDRLEVIAVFLGLNRLKVATTRTRCACILVASPRLFEAERKSPRQMHLANAFCRYVEPAEDVSLDAAGIGKPRGH